MNGVADMGVFADNGDGWADNEEGPEGEVWPVLSVRGWRRPWGEVALRGDGRSRVVCGAYDVEAMRGGPGIIGAIDMVGEAARTGGVETRAGIVGAMLPMGEAKRAGEHTPGAGLVGAALLIGELTRGGDDTLGGAGTIGLLDDGGGIGAVTDDFTAMIGGRVAAMDPILSGEVGRAELSLLAGGGMGGVACPDGARMSSQPKEVVVIAAFDDAGAAGASKSSPERRSMALA